jgi:hypothetical protein
MSPVTTRFAASSFPIVGPSTLTIMATEAAGWSGIIHIGFTVEPTPTPPMPGCVKPLRACVEAVSGGHVASAGAEMWRRPAEAGLRRHFCRVARPDA